MAVSHSPAGFAGTVDEIAEARRFGLSAPPFRVASVNDWAPSADVSVNRQVNISAGQGAAYGVADITTNPDSVTFAPNGGSTNRFDAVVATFAWAANSGAGLLGHTVTFRVIPGTTTPPQVNTTTTLNNAKINRVRGIQYDALIAIVRIRPSVGLLTSGDVVDCRMWAGYEGYANTGTATYLTSLDTQPGSLVHATDTDIVWSRLANGAWGFEKWTGTDKTKQPMFSGRALHTSIPSSFTATVVTWDSGSVVDHSQGLFALQPDGKTVRCNAYGRVRVEAVAISDYTNVGTSIFKVPWVAAGGSLIQDFPDERKRSVGFAGSGGLQQPLFGGPVQVAPGDVLQVTVTQYNPDNAGVFYDIYFLVSYV